MRAAFFATAWTGIVEGRKNLLPSLQECLEQANLATTATDLIDYWFAMDSRIDHTILQDCSMLRSAGLKIFLATNQEHLRAAFLMKNMALQSYVDGIFYSAKIGARKPSFAFYNYADAHSGCTKAQTLLIDDTIENISSAKAFGWQAHHWSGEANLLDIVRS